MSTVSKSAIDPLRAQSAPLRATAPAAGAARGNAMALCCLLAGCAAVSGLLFYRGLFGQILSDHDEHIRFAQRGAQEGIWPVHFLYPVLVHAVSGFRADFNSMAWGALVVLTASVMLKAWLTYVVLTRECAATSLTTLENKLHLPQAVLVAGLAGVLLLAAPVARPWWINRIYLGQISPNVWHNPTSVLCWPLAILLFFAGSEFLRTGRRRMLAAVMLLAAASVLAKPNYFLAFAPVFGLLALSRFGVSRNMMLAAAALLPTVGILVWQLATSFSGPMAMRPDLQIVFRPLAAWHLHSNWIAISLLFSLAYPLAYLAVYRRQLKHRELFVFAWGVMFAALVWAVCFAEVSRVDGHVDFDFNFSWGAHLSLFVLFVVTTIDLVENAPFANAARPSLASLPWWLLGAHAASGVLWIARQAIGRGFA